MEWTLNINVNCDLSDQAKEWIMAKLSDFTTTVDGMRGQLTAILTAVQALENQIAAGDMPAADEQQALDQVNSLKQQIQALADAVQKPAPAPVSA